MKPILGYLAIAIGVIIFFIVIFVDGGFSNKARPFSTYTVLSASWESYKKKFINNDGRVIDFSQNSVTTSEGQSYALLRAVWVDDKPTFDKVWTWTKDNLQKRDDHLLGWLWGQKEDSSYGFLPNGGDNSAADADSDIALALILASRRWHQSQYADEAKAILGDIWSREVATVSGKPYLIAGNWAQDQQQIVINPSYFAPYAWRIFASVDTSHDWNSLIAPAYGLLENSTNEPLDKGKGVLPPNWIRMTKVDGKIYATDLADHTTDYGFDAMRIPWRIGLDYLWNQDSRALSYLAHFNFLADEYSNKGKLVSEYSHDGKDINGVEAPAMYGTILGSLIFTNPDLAKRVYEEKVVSLYSNDTGGFNDNLGYYDQNWLWFGVAIYEKYLEHY